MKERKTKVFTVVDLKLDAAGEGTFEAVFATLDEIDHDGDTYEPGAFGEQEVVISQWNHGSWGRGTAALPIGVGKVFERDNKAIVSGEFDLEDADGEKTYKKLKYLKSKGRNVEWSFALPESDGHSVERDGRFIWVYTRIVIPEVSPVLMGAGVGTELLSIKSGEEVEKEIMKQKPEQGKQFATHLDEAVETVEGVLVRAKEIRTLRDEQGKSLSKAAVRRLKLLADTLDELGKAVDELLSDPNDELKEFVKTMSGGDHE